MKSSTALLSLAILSVAAFAFGIILIPSPASSQAAADSFSVSFEEYPSLDHVCFIIDVENSLATDASIPLKPLLNATSIDVQKAQTKLYLEREYTRTVTSCNACAVESCFEGNATEGTNGTICQNVTITDCSACGSTETQVPEKAWEEVELASTDRTVTAETKELKNTFADVAMKSGKPERYKLCYHFNEIPINPSTGKPGSYGYMYLDIGGKSYFDFEHSSWWNTSMTRWAVTTISNDSNPFLVNDTYGLDIGGGIQYVWCPNTTTYVYNDTLGRIYCSNDTNQIDTFIDQGNGTSDGSPGLLAWYHLNGTADSSGNGYDLATNVNVQQLYSDCKIGNCMRFTSSSSSYLQTNAAIATPPSGTIMLWVNESVLADNSYWAGSGSGPAWSDISWYIGHDANNIEAYITDGSAGFGIQCAKSNLVANQWNHVAWLWDNDGNWQAVFVNGKLCKNESWTQPPGNFTKPVHLGKRFEGQYLNGMEDEFRYYSRPLTYAEVVAVYNNTKPDGYSSVGSLETYAPPAPQMTIFSPENTTYATENVDLVWSADRPLDGAAYSLNGGANSSLFFWEGNYTDYAVDLFYDPYGQSPPYSQNQPKGISYDGEYFWVTESDFVHGVYKYFLNWTYAGYFNTTEITYPWGVTHQGDYLWITDSDYYNSNVYRYWPNGTYANFSFNTESENCFAHGITNDSIYLWVLCDNIEHDQTYVFKYFPNGTYSGISFNLSNEIVLYASGITQNGTYFWVTDINDYKVYKYSADSGNYTGFYFITDEMYPWQDTPYGIAYESGNLWIVSGIPGIAYRYQANTGGFLNTTIEADEGSNTLTLCGNDTEGNLGCSSVNFFVDSIPPEVSVSFPANNTRYNLTLMSITGTAYDDNWDSVWINDSNFGTNLGDYTDWNFTYDSIPEGSYSLLITANDTAGNEKTAEVHFTVGVWNITFHVYSGEDGSNLTNVNAYCNNSWSGTIDNGDTIGFNSGDYECTFQKLTYFNKTISFSVNNDHTENVKMSEEDSLTREEHDWLEYLYDCWSTGNCRDTLNSIETMVVYINQTTTQINETVNKVWDQFKETDESVVLDEVEVSNVLNSTSNITYTYSIAVPEKEDYEYLPIRIYYWLLDSGDNRTCYSQAKESDDAEIPFCKPMIAQTVGKVNEVLNFTVELRPDIPEGVYKVIRRIDIDPDEVWINYGHEEIGTVEVKENTEGKGPVSSLRLSAESSEDGKVEGEGQKADASDSMTGLSIGELFNPMAVSMALSVVTLLAVAYLVVSRKK